MLNTFKEFENMAFIINDAKQAAKTVREGSFTHRLAWCAFAILASGTSEDKESLTNAVAKGASYEAQKGTVSKAKFVLSYLNEGYEVSGLSLNDFTTMLDNGEVPTFKLLAIYNGVKGEVKAESDEEKRTKAIRKHAMAMMQVAHPEVAITNKTFDAHPSKVQFLADAAPVIDNRLAAQAKVQANETREALTNRLINEIISNGLESVIIQALSGKAQASQATQAA